MVRQVGGVTEPSLTLSAGGGRGEEEELGPVEQRCRKVGMEGSSQLEEYVTRQVAKGKERRVRRTSSRTEGS
jgi:hypothetical protein